MRLVALAPGKVNLCLALGALRPDGRHELVTLIESLSLADELELVTRVALHDEVVCAGVEEPNIVAQALAGLRALRWPAPKVKITVHKRIPVAAGMGGGSADAAATLRIAQRLAPVPEALIWRLAAQLGADVPSQLDPGLVLATGAGEVVEPVGGLAGEVVEPVGGLAGEVIQPVGGLAGEVGPHALTLLPSSSESLSTAAVYAEADRLGLSRTPAQLAALRGELRAALREPGRLPAALLVNDLAPAALALCPSIEVALEAARDAGAEDVLVCGSGPTVAGLFWGADAPARAALAAGSLAGRFPRAAVAVPVARGFGFPLFA
ncbi:MAG: 4-(cytidine 5'-diphospho)-2-C-methyl-D-erythritol kinase [Solirubrobacteraceae bacterium]